ncbi:hypothetical protein PACTADRAFT_50043 [Pachysolen tannophilus NRRL Y-2460]|uniref:PUM-HD domain-containing protein n=1 Tax=Pachysolen tannophilus NRRL Y-2460 TaxID=669874 RepID=A0A1E4TUA4_PACTA|nr:hypothetical protein PACTADRAFT_50043 [Pachysolen tannophilus NRRL Y-2460]
MVSGNRAVKRSIVSDSLKNGVKKQKKSENKKEVKQIETPSYGEESSNSDSESGKSDNDDDSESSDDSLDSVSESEEDELDELDDLDGDEGELNGDAAVEDDANEDEANEDDGDAEDSKPKQSSKEQHAEQKKLLEERKLQRKAGVEVQKIKFIWEKLRVKNPPLPKDIREKLCNDIWELSKDVIKDLVMKHDSSRVVQTLVKYSSKQRRDVIVSSLKGNYYQLATSSYGKYLLVKLLHYGSKESRDLILNELHGKLRKLMRHREGAYVVEDLYVLYATANQKKQMIREFWGAEYAVFKNAGDGKDIEEVAKESEEKKALITRNLIGTITASVDKGSTGFQILHAVMEEYIKICDDKQTHEFIELLHEQFAELVHTPEGSNVACTLIAKATAKERKMILKTLKAHAKSLITNEHGNLVLTTIFMTVDDTVLVSKSFVNEYSSTMHELIVDKFSRRPFLYLLNGLDPHFFSPITKKELLRYEEFSKETSKKPQEQRRLELLKAFGESFFECIINHPFESLGENIGSQFVGEVLLNEDIDTDKREKALNTIIESFNGKALSEDHLINKPFSARLLRTLIQGGRWNAKEKTVVKVKDSCLLGLNFTLKFINEIFEEGENENALKAWIKSPGSFVVIALFESIQNENCKEDTAKNFLKIIKNLKNFLAKEAEENGNKGAQLLIKLQK